MKPRLLFWLLAGLLLLSGCLPSLNAVFTDKDLIFDPFVVGVWTNANATEKWDFTKHRENCYLLVYTDDEGRQGRFVAHLAEVDGVRFLDLFPEKIDTSASPFYNLHLVPMHTIYLVKQTEPVLQMAAMDYTWLDKFLADHPDAIQHAVFNGRKLITAPTEEVQAFVIEHKDAFTASFDLKRAAINVN
jgi:hypothetical protein